MSHDKNRKPQTYRNKALEQRSFGPWQKRFGETYRIRTRLSDLSEKTLYYLALPGDNSSNAFYEFIMGVIASVLVATIAAYATGTATKPKKTTVKHKKTRKAWDVSKTKEVWMCNRCGQKIPPGAFTCPNCGEPVIE